MSWAVTIKITDKDHTEFLEKDAQYDSVNGKTILNYIFDKSTISQSLINNICIINNKLEELQQKYDKLFAELQYRPNQVIECPTCHDEIEIEKGGIKFEESKKDFNDRKKVD